MRLGEVIKQYREERGLSQAEFAKKCGLSDALIVFAERGQRSDGSDYRPRISTLQKLADGLGIKAEVLIRQCDDFKDIRVGPDGVSIYEDMLQERDEVMLLQAYRMIPAEHRIEAMQAVFRVKDKYTV